MKKIKTFFIGIFTIFFYIYFQTFLYEIINISNKSYFLQNLLLLVPILIVSLVFFVVYRKDLIKQFSSYDKEDLIITFKYWFYGLSIMYLVNIIILPFTNDLAITEEGNRLLLTKLPFFATISMGIFGPFCEEMCFRYSFKNAFNKRWVYVLITSILFGLVHINSFELKEFLFILPYSVMGGALGLAYYDTKNIFSSIFMHMFNNVAMIFLLIVNGGLFWESFYIFCY